MTVNDMRNALKHRYGDIIRGCHVDYMPNSQVFAIYSSLIDRGDPSIGKSKPVPKTKRLHKPVTYEQIRMEI